MFDVGFWELFILFGLGLVILGPERLPKVAIQVGNWAGQARRMARQLSGQIRSEINDLDIPNEIDIKDPFASTASSRETPNYNRPGVDDLKPSNKESRAQSTESDDTTADKAG